MVAQRTAHNDRSRHTAKRTLTSGDAGHLRR